MEETSKNFNGDEVVSIDNEKENILINHRTYKVKDFLEKLSKNLDYNQGKKWISEGVACEILSPNQSWQKGKIKICLQFIPEQPESILDDIRQAH
ncbi:KGK family protein [Pleurocapsales cyanobacterium LEGE 10410]|nr:KGK family protein [Pleurocapsales cyanobacterium LEGE 10410]